MLEEPYSGESEANYTFLIGNVKNYTINGIFMQSHLHFNIDFVFINRFI